MRFMGRVAALSCFLSSWTIWATTLSGLKPHGHWLPRVARCSQPWALLRDPFGILPRMASSKDACKVQIEGGPSISLNTRGLVVIFFMVFQSFFQPPIPQTDDALPVRSV